MTRVNKRRAAMIAQGEDVPILRASDTKKAEVKKNKRVPPHLAGPTARLSNDLQAKDYDDAAFETEEPS